jgi:NTP pyrophosphatase (non-canonical NTP hydrolase)
MERLFGYMGAHWENTMITLSSYQAAALMTAQYPDLGNNLIYPALGLAGEAGETVDKIKKLWRNKGVTSKKQLSKEDKEELIKELGDVLWYVAALASEMDTDLAVVATRNIEKLQDRQKRGVIKSRGDNR